MNCSFTKVKSLDFLITFISLSHRPQISNFPLFSLFQYISPCFAKIIIFPYFDKFSPLFYTNSPAFYMLYVFFVYPPTFTMIHLCISQCTYWTPLAVLNAFSSDQNFSKKQGGMYLKQWKNRGDIRNLWWWLKKSHHKFRRMKIKKCFRKR